MITETQLLLMTAAIDGVLTAGQGKRLARLLDSSAEARLVFAKLKADCDRIRALPRATPPANLQKRILARVATATPPMGRPLAEPAQPAAVPYRTPRWLPVAVAASLLMCAIGGSFWFFNRSDSAGNIARSPKRPPPSTHAGATDPAWSNWLPVETEPRPSIPTPRERPEQHFVVRPDTQSQPIPPQPPVTEPDGIAQAPLPRSVRTDLLGGQPERETHFEEVQIRIPFLKPLADLDRQETRQELIGELARDPAFRIDLFTRDPARGVEVFQATAKAQGLTVFADTTTMDRLKKRQLNSVVIYTESLSAAELVDLFGKLCAEDAKISPRVFDILHATPATDPGDAASMKSILGIDPGLFKHPAADKAEKSADPSKPISAGTADHIVKSVTKSGEKSAVLLTWMLPPARPLSQTQSAELKQFLSKRGDRKANVVPVLIVIRPGV